MRITIGTYKQTKYTFISGTTTLTIYGFPWSVDGGLRLITNDTGASNSGVGYVIKAPTIKKCTIGYAYPRSTVTVGTATTGGAVTVGSHSYIVTYVYDTGDESIASTTSSVITIVSGTATVPLTNIPIGPTGVVYRNIYRTVAGNTGNYLLLTTIADNTTQTYSDIIADASLGVNVPTTSNAYDIDFSTLPTVTTGDLFTVDAEIPDETVDYNFNLVKTQEQSQSELPPTSVRVAEWPVDTNQVAGTYFYESGSAENYRNFLLQLLINATTLDAFLKIYKTLDNTIAVTATNGTPVQAWTDCTSEKFGVSEVIVNAGIPFSFYDNLNFIDDKKLDMPDRYMISLRVQNATWTLTGNVRQF